MDDTSTKDKWTQVRIEFELVREVDEIVREARVHGARRYFSRSDFVKDAVLRLLGEYSEQSKSRRKKVGEEILVTGK